VIKKLRWIWAMWRLYDLFWHKKVLFSKRQALLTEVQPRTSDKVTRFAYPDAIFLITPSNVAEAEKKVFGGKL
jgi:hypothetical protein